MPILVVVLVKVAVHSVVAPRVADLGKVARVAKGRGRGKAKTAIKLKKYIMASLLL
jgi:hypothetical protein